MDCVNKTFIHVESDDIIVCLKSFQGISKFVDSNYYLCSIKNENKYIEEFIIPANIFHKMVTFNELKEIVRG